MPDRWLPVVRDWLGKPLDKLTAEDFPATGIRVRFPEGSTVEFRHALSCIAALDEGREECLILTERCGNHVFPVGDAEVVSLTPDGDPISDAA